MNRQLLRTITATATVAAIGVLAGCGSQSSGSGGSGASSASGAAPSASPAAQQGASNSGGSVADGIGHSVHLCSLFPVTTAASLSGENLTKAQEQDTPGYKIYMCNYTSADGTSGVTVSVLAQDASVGYDANLQAVGSGAKQINGLGDKAFSGITGVQALFGNVSITVSNLQSDSASEAIIRAVHAKL